MGVAKKLVARPPQLPEVARAHLEGQATTISHSFQFQDEASKLLVSTTEKLGQSFLPLIPPLFIRQKLYPPIATDQEYGILITLAPAHSQERFHTERGKAKRSETIGQSSAWPKSWILLFFFNLMYEFQIMQTSKCRKFSVIKKSMT